MDARFEKPQHWHAGEFVRDGRRIHYGHVFPNDAKAVVVCFAGLSEFSEKYYELAREMNARGYGFAIMDWMGQGLSGRYLPDQQKRHVGAHGFKDDLADAHYFITQILPPSDLPRTMIGHSMGGHLGLRMLHDYPDLFACAALSAPFLGVHGFDIMPPWLLRGLAALLQKYAPYSYVPGGRPFHEDDRCAGEDRFSSDPERGALHNFWMLENDARQVGDVTNTWLKAAVDACQEMMQPDYLRGITTPIVLTLGTAEKIVSNAAIRRAAGELPHARLVEIKGAHHEILMERDALRNQFLHAFDALVLESLGENGHTKKKD